MWRLSSLSSLLFSEMYYLLQYVDDDALQNHDGVKLMKTLDKKKIQVNDVKVGMELLVQWIDKKWYAAVVKGISEEPFSLNSSQLLPKTKDDLRRNYKVLFYFLLLLLG